MIVALALAIVIAEGATIAGGLLHREQKRSCPSEGGIGCADYYVYGWPWAWRNDAPDELVERWRERERFQGEETSIWDLYHGNFSLGWFMFSSLVWFLVVLVIEAGIAALAWVVSRLIVRKERSSPA